MDITLKEIQNILRQKKLMPKAYIIDWYIRDLRHRGKTYSSSKNFVEFVQELVGRYDTTYQEAEHRVRDIIKVNYERAHHEWLRRR